MKKQQKRTIKNKPREIVLEFVEPIRQATPGGYIDAGASVFRQHESVEAFLAYKNPPQKVEVRKPRPMPQSCASVMTLDRLEELV